MLFFKKVIFALISSLTLYIGNVYNLLPKKGEGGGSSDPSDPPLPTPLIPTLFPPAVPTLSFHRVLPEVRPFIQIIHLLNKLLLSRLRIYLVLLHNVCIRRKDGIVESRGH